MTIIWLLNYLNSYYPYFTCTYKLGTYYLTLTKNYRNILYQNKLQRKLNENTWSSMLTMQFNEKYKCFYKTPKCCLFSWRPEQRATPCAGSTKVSRGWREPYYDRHNSCTWSAESTLNQHKIDSPIHTPIHTHFPLHTSNSLLSSIQTSNQSL